MDTPRKYNAAGDPTLGPESTRDLATLSGHIARAWGAEPYVLHEIASDYVHIDLHIVRASEDRPYHTVITTGMSDRPMKAPTGNDEFRYCELLLALPPEWPIDDEAIKGEQHWWPFRHLKQTARFPHVCETWLSYGHTIANEDPPQPFHETARFCGGILYIPTLCSEDAWRFKIRDDKEVFFLSLIPLFEPELRFGWEHGSAALLEKLDAANVNELVHVNRPSVVY